MDRELTFKYHCYHFYLLREQMKDIVEVSQHIQRSNLPHEIIGKSWINNAQLLLIKYNNYFKDWIKARDFCTDLKVVKVVTDQFKVIDEQWPDIEKFRNEVLSHAFATPINGSMIRKQSIFSLEKWKPYGILEESNDYIRLHNHLASISEFLKFRDVSD